MLKPTDDFLKQGTSYYFKNQYTEEVSAFLHKYFLIYDTETAGISTFIYHLSPFLFLMEKYTRNSIELIMRRRARVFSDYFRILYIDMDIGLCEKNYGEFKRNLNQFDVELRFLKNKLVRDLVKFKIM